MKKEQSTADTSQVLSSEKVILGQSYLLSGNTLHQLSTEYSHSNAPIEEKFRSAKEMEKLVLDNCRTLFGQQTFLIPMPKKSESLFENGFTPSAFLLDVTDPAKPRFYFLDTALAGADFYGYVFPRITKFFLLPKNQEFIILSMCRLR